ncbi:MAG: glycosyltransferase family 4 protein [Syntrophomonadaceae bacterium]|nr:glycosyltransferase family 4 protein [Syntrophomonadaceae bacterium]
MKILYLYKYGVLGGVSTQLLNRLKYLINFCEPHFGFLQDYGIKSSFEDYPFVYFPENIAAIIKLINKNNYDIIITIDTNEVYEAIRQANFKGIVINEVHTTYEKSLKTFQNLIGNTAMQAVITPSNYLKQRILREFMLDSSIPIYVVENCLDNRLFAYQPPIINPAKKIILWVGKLDDHKNWLSFLSISALIRSLRKDCQFWLVGGYTAPEKVRRHLREMVNRLGLTDCFKWITRAEYAEMPALYSLTVASGGVCVSTSRNESFGMTIIEALACGCPSIAPSVGAIPEILDKELSFYLYEPGNEAQSAEKILFLIKDTGIRKYLTEVGRKTVAACYTIENIGEKYLATVNNILEMKKGR